ncbi:MAG: hypothetical protein Ct9H90mP20_3530 [Candidatus Neomarinimicrobiota bacterium]|nr:MAG: hypothetical protein Ct9H90mP20_3530 [Candidatus Neomarinimicrobiota bacterium]
MDLLFNLNFLVRLDLVLVDPFAIFSETLTDKPSSIIIFQSFTCLIYLGIERIARA